MAQLHHLWVLAAVSCLLGLLPSCLQAFKEQPCSLSFHLLLQPAPPLNLHNKMPLQPQQQQPFTGPHLFFDEPLLQYTPHGNTVVGSASGLYLADSADWKQVRYLFFTAAMQHYEYEYEEVSGGAQLQALSGSVVLMGSLSAGALSMVGGTGHFAFAVGQAKVSMAPAATSNSSTMAISLHLGLSYMEEHSAF